MPGFMYFVPGAASSDEAIKTLRQMGAAYALEGRTAFQACDAGGPDGVAGILGETGPLHIPESETPAWREVAGGAFYVGLVRSDPPAPADLFSESALPGLEVELGDGNRWIIPIVRDPSGEAAVPRCRMLGPDGKWRPGAVAPRFAELWKGASRVWDALLGALTGSPVVVKDADALAVQALGVNYRVAAAEVELLGLLEDKARIVDVLKAAVAWPAVTEILTGEDGDEASHETDAADRAGE